jgi:hypothetical protein
METYATSAKNTGKIKGREHADPSHPLALLRARRERPGSRRAAEQRHELPPSHAGHGSSLPPGLPQGQPATRAAGRSMGKA